MGGVSWYKCRAIRYRCGASWYDVGRVGWGEFACIAASWFKCGANWHDYGTSWFWGESTGTPFFRSWIRHWNVLDLILRSVNTRIP